MVLTFPSPAETVVTINLFGFAAVVRQLVHPLLSQQLVPLGLYLSWRGLRCATCCSLWHCLLKHQCWKIGVFAARQKNILIFIFFLWQINQRGWNLRVVLKHKTDRGKLLIPHSLYKPSHLHTHVEGGGAFSWKLFLSSSLYFSLSCNDSLRTTRMRKLD